MSSYKSDQTLSPTPINVKGLALSRGGRVLFDDMSWQLPHGRVMVVTGPSGAGKTSLLACLRGALTADRGSVSLGTGVSSKVGVVFQHLRLTGNLSVLTNVLCGGLGAHRWWQTLFGFSAEEKLRAFEIITEFGLAPLVHRPVRSISGGEKQRTAIARVLFQGPDIILADEPTSSLDPQLSQQVMKRLRSLCRDEGRSVIAVLHERGLVEQFADIELELGCGEGSRWRMREIR